MLEARPGPAPKGRDTPSTTAASGERERAAGGDAALVCAACRHRITDEAYRVERGGAHAHTFVNPGGFVHHLGCFALAPGCVHAGDPETAFSWFPGWTWQLAECARCRTHLGWLFRCAGEQFHGLIVDKLSRRA